MQLLRSLAAPARALAVVLCASLVAAQTDVQQPDEIEKLFGGAPGEPGFRILFARVGATIKHVNLTDHDAEDQRADGTRDEYLLSDVLWAQPGNPAAGYYAWLELFEWDAGRRRLEVDPRFAPWQVVENVDDAIRFEIDVGGGLILEKSFWYERGRRDLGIEIAMRATDTHEAAGEDLMLRLTGLAVRAPRSEYMLGQNVALAVGETVDPAGETEFRDVRADGSPNPSDPREYPVIVSRGETTRISFAGSTNRFFGAFLYPVDEAASRALWMAQMHKRPAAEQADTPVYTIPAAEFGISLGVPEAGGESRLRFRYFMGPKSKRVFDAEPEYVRFDHVVDNDLAPGCFCEIPGARMMARFLLWLLGNLYDLVGNWGIAIMLLTVLVRSALVPLNFRMQKSMRAYGAKAAKLKPKLEAIQKQYANDKKALQQAMMEFQREHKMFPPLGGCLPMFVTIPVFIGLFTALRTSYDLRQQAFVGWIDDLSEPDALFELGWSFIPYFNLLPILMVGLWWWLQSSTPLPSDPQQRQMMKIMRFMPLMFGVMLYGYASGLMVYMITSSMFAIGEQRITRRILGPISPDAAGFAGPQI